MSLEENMVFIQIEKMDRCVAALRDQPRTYHMDTIGVLRSCFRKKFGTPRQGSLSPLSRARFELHCDIAPSSLEGLDEYSHLWLVFVFEEEAGRSFRPKVRPPKLGHGRTGVFSTRSPHRVNPIGLSAAKIEHVNLKEGTVLLSGIDLIHNTAMYAWCRLTHSLALISNRTTMPM